MIGSDVIPQYAEDVTLRRFAAGTVVRGRHTPGAVTESTIRAAVFPISGEERTFLPEGVRAREPVKVFTLEAMQTDPADELEYRDATYEIVTVLPWHHGGFWESIAQKKVAT